MESFSVYVVAVALLTAAQGETERTLDDYYKDVFNQELLEIYMEEWRYSEGNFSDALPYYKYFWNRNHEAIQYSHTIYKKAVSEFISSVAKVPLQFVVHGINDTYGEYAERWTEYRNKTCGVNWTKNWLKVKLEKAMELAIKNVSYECSSHHFCTRTVGNCILAHEERLVKIMNEYIPYLSIRILHQTNSLTEFLIWNVECYLDFMLLTYRIAFLYHDLLDIVMISVPTIEPFKNVNLFRAKVMKFLTVLNHTYSPIIETREYKPIIRTGKEVAWGIIRSTRGTLYNQCETCKEVYTQTYIHYDPIIETQEQFNFGIIRSTHGSVDNQCPTYKEAYTHAFFNFAHFIDTCFNFDALKSYIDLIRCVYQDQDSPSLTWSTVPSAYFYSPCLCLAYGYNGCGVKAPKDVNPLVYCLSVLLRDFQRQISFRPAVTYLDYSLMTRVPICEFSNLLQEKYYEMCEPLVNIQNFDSVLSVQCSFDGLVNENLNCSEITEINTYDETLLCKHYFFMNFVNCEGEVGSSLSFYSPGDSPLVLVLTYVDVSVRLLTLVTYLSCPQLRNLPGKVLIGYQVTALLRLLVVRASLEDLALAVRLDVAFDFSSTLCLTSYLHFLTSSIKTLRLPDSLTPQEVRMVLLRYSLLGWALPAALSASFFYMNEAIESHVQFGQILFVLCYFAALLWNLYMFYYNCLFYYDVKKNALSLKPGTKASTVFTGLFNFALKTSVLSGMGITIRLIFTQIQGLEEVLSYYHAFGTLQGLLVFFLYGCNREARDFWRRILCVTLRQRFRRQNTVV